MKCKFCGWSSDGFKDLIEGFDDLWDGLCPDCKKQTATSIMQEVINEVKSIEQNQKR